MFIIDGDEITLTRGDTLQASVAMYEDENLEDAYTPDQNDVLKFYLKTLKYKRDKSDYAEETPLITKTIPIDTCILRLDPADTKQLPVGDYVYDIELTRHDGVVDTFINNATFTLVYEVG